MNGKLVHQKVLVDEGNIKARVS